MLTGPIVEADDRLHPLRNTDNQHHQKHPDAGDDTVGPQSQVAAILFQGVVLDNDNQAARQLHGERRNTDRQDIPYHMAFQFESTFMETDNAVFLNKMVHDEQGTEQHGDDRCNSRSPDTHIQPEYKDRVEYHVGYRSDQHGKHGLLRIAGCTHDSVETKAERSQDRSGDHNIQVVFGIRNRLFASAKGQQEVFHPDHTGDDRDDRNNECQRKGISQDLFRHLVRFPPQMDGDTGSRTCPHQHAECLQEEQDREGQRQSGNSQRTDSLTDKDTVHNIIQSIYHRPDHRRDSIL